MSEKVDPTNKRSRALVRTSQGMVPAEVAKMLEGLSVQAAIPPELMPAIAEMLGYIHQMDEVAEKRRQIQRR